MKDEVMNFRVQVDLSQFYNDERKLSYIYIDKTKITNVFHLQTKIQNIFGIIQPLCLSVNNVFLPANEDIRIIKEDEVVFVQSFFPTSKNSTPPLCDVPRKIHENYNTVGESMSPSGKSDSTDVEIFDSAKNSVNGTQIVNSHVLESEGPQRKRKRTRRRKKSLKNEISRVPLATQLNSSTTNKQTITEIDVKKSRPTHLKFSWDESNNYEKEIEVTENPFVSKPTIRSTESINLKTLLNLGTNPIPPTFSGQRRTRNNSVASSLTKNLTTNGSSDKINTSTINACSTPINSNIDYLKINHLKYPIHEGMFKVGDVIVFETLVMNKNYCPDLSAPIVAKIITNDLLAKSYSCQILSGSDQLKNPEGKFALPTDNEEEDSKEKEIDGEPLYTLKHSDLYEPRLIHRETQH